MLDPQRLIADAIDHAPIVIEIVGCALFWWHYCIQIQYTEYRTTTWRVCARDIEYHQTRRSTQSDPDIFRRAEPRGLRCDHGTKVSGFRHERARFLRSAWDQQNRDEPYTEQRGYFRNRSFNAQRYRRDHQFHRRLNQKIFAIVCTNCVDRIQLCVQVTRQYRRNEVRRSSGFPPPNPRRASDGY